MTRIRNKLIAFVLPISLILLLILTAVFITSAEKTHKNKILFEYSSDGAIAVEDNIENIPNDVRSQNSDFALQIMFNYDHYNDDLYEMQSSEGESYLDYSKEYHTTKNQLYLSEIDTDNFEVFVSEYTPYVFLNYCGQNTLEQTYAYAESIADNDFIDTIRIFPSDVYALDLEALEVVDGEPDEPQSAVIQPIGDSIYHPYENFPDGTPYKGNGIKIGVLDTGIFDTSHGNFAGVTKEIVYDTYTSNDNPSSAYHPTWVAAVLGGSYGYAPRASLYYVDVNSETGYVGIERLINKGCSIVNMSISANSCLNNGEYNTGLEGYLDYIYTSTKIIMVASAGNNLDRIGTGGFVALPALCANVISVGSVTAAGVPSAFSSYNTKNLVYSNPNLVAVGSDRQITGIGNKSGTSFSAPAVTGALALYFEKNGVKELPEVLAVLSATANDSIINKSVQTISMSQKDASGQWVATDQTITCTNNLKENGSRERTGAGMLDITALLNYSNTLINYELTFTSNDYIELKEVYLSAGQTIQIGLAWQRNATLTNVTDTTYSSNAMADIDLFLFNSNGLPVDSSIAVFTNVEIITYTAGASGYYTIRIKPISNYTDTHNINYAYVIK